VPGFNRHEPLLPPFGAAFGGAAPTVFEADVAAGATVARVRFVPSSSASRSDSRLVRLGVEAAVGGVGAEPEGVLVVPAGSAPAGVLAGRLTPAMSPTVRAPAAAATTVPAAEARRCNREMVTPPRCRRPGQAGVIAGSRLS